MEKQSFPMFKTKQKKRKPPFHLGQPVQAADKENFFSNRNSTNWSYKLYDITQIIHDTIPSYRINIVPER